MRDTPFTEHADDTIALNCNAVPLPQCKVYPTLKDGKGGKYVHVEIMSCADVWLRCQREAEAWLKDPATGKTFSRPEDINRQINRAYAHLWLQDQRFQWAGLAAFASKQVGCGMLHVRELQKEADRHLRQHSGLSDAVWMESQFQLGAAISGSYMLDVLALGNLTLFLDIYPLHRFYMLRGFNGLAECLQDRMKIRDKVLWPEKAKRKLEFGKNFAEIKRAFDLIEQKNVPESVFLLAYHEQVNVLQNVIYDDELTRKALDANQMLWVTGLLRGSAMEVELTLSAKCKAAPTLTSWFPKSGEVHLWDQNDRLKFVRRTATEFDRLLKDERYRRGIEQAIREIANGRGIT
jgi:hypothetical protein